MAESFFATLECELLDRTTLSTHAEARAAVFDFIEGWYNTRGCHLVLRYRSLLRFERLHAAPVDGARFVDTLRVPSSPLDPALRTGSTPSTRAISVHRSCREPENVNLSHETGATFTAGGLWLGSRMDLLYS